MLQPNITVPKHEIVPPSPDSPLSVLEGVELRGRINTDDEIILSQIRHSIRRGHPQVWQQGVQLDRVILVGSGPSLRESEKEIRDLLWNGALLVTVNGAYQWCVERNLKPNAQIVLDARESNSRFVSPEVPGCRYYIASQCHSSTWDAVEGREFVGIYHAVDPDGAIAEVLNQFYARNWQPTAGGTTVTTRAIGLLRTLGYLRFDLFGIDSCWFGEDHHAFDQPENQRDKKLKVVVSPTGDPDKKKEFTVSPWHLKQLEDFLQFIRINGDQFLLNVHGDGLIAHAIKGSAEIIVDESNLMKESEDVSTGLESL